MHVIHDPINGIEDITPLVNRQAIKLGSYRLKNKAIVDSCNNLAKFNVDSGDLGITILMMNLGKYLSHGQYPIFILEFSDILELRYIEDFLYYNTKPKSSKLKKTLCICSKYGLKAMQNTFIHFQYLTLQQFHLICKFIVDKNSEDKDFVSIVELLHINIIESLYSLITLDKTSLNIIECRNAVVTNELQYVLPKCLPDRNIIDSKFWFTIPIKSVWFAYRYTNNKDCYKFFGYVSRDKDALLAKLRVFVDQIVIGYISGYTVNVIKVDDLYASWGWQGLYDKLNMSQLPNIFKPTVVQNGIVLGIEKKNKIYFVRDKCASIFKYN